MAYSKLRRNTSQRKALLRSLVADLLINNRIITTESKAKEIKRIVDKIITLSKQNNLSARRLALNFLFNKKIDSNITVLQKLFQEIVPKYENKISGYTKIIKGLYRRGDAAPLALISLID
ncbi:MAG: 50S ribosomal protein L17 [Candidatus Phytoplasma stylosanthis]|nr:50S ribosomal protein L17 [Candidatus Phytoplasma stylosanthis]